jgi:hypothetical protein
MENLARERLKNLLADQGRDFYRSPDRCAAALQDCCAEFKRERNLLITALREGVPTALVEGQRQGLPLQLLVGQQTQALIDQHGTSKELASWTVEAWAEALGLLYTGDELPKPDPVNPDQHDRQESPEVDQRQPAPVYGGPPPPIDYFSSGPATVYGAPPPPAYPLPLLSLPKGKFVMRWLIVNAIAQSLGQQLGYALGFQVFPTVERTVALLLYGATVGAVVGAAQWQFVLRRYASESQRIGWLGATTMGYAAAFFLWWYGFDRVYPPPPVSSVNWVIANFVGPAILGTAQWLVYRKFCTGPHWQLLAALTLGNTIPRLVGLRYDLLSGAISGIIFALITGPVLAYRLQQPATKFRYPYR